MSDTDMNIDVPVDETGKTGAEPEIVIVDEAPASEQNVAKNDDNKADLDPAKALEKLRKKLKKEKERADEAERAAQRAMQQVNTASSEVEDTHLHLVNNAISTVKRDQDILRMNYRDSMANGDYDRAAEIQEAMSMNAAKLLQLENGFNEMRNKPRQPVQQQPQEITVDTLIGRVTPKSAEWLKENRDELRDSRSLRIMGRAHDDAVDMGITPESKEYFRFIENRLGIGRDDTETRETRSDESYSGASAPVQRRQSPPAAPVTRSGNGTGQRPGQITLTAAQVEAAKISGLTPKQYYDEMMREKNRQH